MDAVATLQLALDPSLILTAQGLPPDPWQREYLLSRGDVLLNCCRGAGKTRATSALALHTALFPDQRDKNGSLILLTSRAERQAMELLRYIKQGFNAIGRPIPLLKENEHELEFANGSRIVSLPGKEGNIRGYQGVRLLVIDEAARVPNDLISAVSAMTQTARGRQVWLSTPFGQRGKFWEEWHDERAKYVRFRVPWQRVPRYTAEILAEEERKFGRQWVSQEYECSFEAMSGLVYPDFLDCVYLMGPIPAGRPVGGIDFGYRNPFAAVYGVLDRDDVLWVERVYYRREATLAEHRAWITRHTPRETSWYADPAGASDIAQLRAAGLTVRKGNNDIRLGIQAVTARIRTRKLKVRESTCSALIEEAKVHRYPDAKEAAVLGENPIDSDNHALGALRYLVSRIDHRLLCRLRRAERGETPEPEAAEQKVLAAQYRRPWDDESLWESL